MALPLVSGVEDTFRAAVADHEDVFSLSTLGQFLSDLGRHDEAEKVFERALQCDSPKGCLPAEEARALAMGWYASMIEGRGQEGVVKAEALYKSALRINEEDPLAMGNYAVFLHRVKRNHAVSWKLRFGSYRKGPYPFVKSIAPSVSRCVCVQQAVNGWDGITERFLFDWLCFVESRRFC